MSGFTGGVRGFPTENLLAPSVQAPRPDVQLSGRASRDGRAFALLLALAPTACVIPVAPEFEDPEANYPPYLFSSDPPAGAEILSGDTTEIVVTVADPNVNDNLHVRWIFDYPKYDDNLTRVVPVPTLPPSGNRGVVRDTIRIQPNCLIHNIAKGVSRHRVTLSVSDRGFVSERVAPREFQADTVPNGGFLLRATWYLNLECK